MKDPIVLEIHDYRAAYAKQFAYDISAIGDAIRAAEADSSAKFIAPRRSKSRTGTKRLKARFRK